jgi:hypothetical protein
MLCTFDSHWRLLCVVSFVSFVRTAQLNALMMQYSFHCEQTGITAVLRRLAVSLSCLCQEVIVIGTVSVPEGHLKRAAVGTRHAIFALYLPRGTALLQRSFLAFLTNT